MKRYWRTVPCRIKNPLWGLGQSRMHNTNKEMECSIEAIVEDVSFNGAKIRYAGAAFPQGLIVHLDTDDLDLHTPAKVVWTKAMIQNTGLQLIWTTKAVSIAV
jgi:hypothetical protein